MGFTQTTARGANFKSLVANDETEVKILTFRTYYKIVKLTVCQLGTVGKKLKRDASYGVLTSANRNRKRELKSKGLGESDSWSHKFSGPTDINYKSTCIVVLDNSLLKNPIVIPLLTRSLEFFVVLLFRILGGSHLDSLKSRAFLPTKEEKKIQPDDCVFAWPKFEWYVWHLLP